VSVCLDASVLVALFTVDASTNRAQTYLAVHNPEVTVSDFAAAEFASAVARRVRTMDLTSDDARVAFASFDDWLVRAAQHVETAAADIAFASSVLRRLDLNLRAPDAINIAICQRLGATLATFDDRMGNAARTLDLQVALA
jgi:uncharacterized protein